jgi:hypothetical protein
VSRNDKWKNEDTSEQAIIATGATKEEDIRTIKIRGDQILCNLMLCHEDITIKESTRCLRIKCRSDETMDFTSSAETQDIGRTTITKEVHTKARNDKLQAPLGKQQSVPDLLDKSPHSNFTSNHNQFRRL